MPARITTVYEHVSVDGGHTATAQLIASISGRRYKAVVSLDTSYAAQSHAELYVFIPGRGFELLLKQHGKEVDVCNSYHSKTPVERGELERKGTLAGILQSSAGLLCQLGHKIVNEAE